MFQFQNLPQNRRELRFSLHFDNIVILNSERNKLWTEKIKGNIIKCRHAGATEKRKEITDLSLQCEESRLTFLTIGFPF